jgi:hypothetical protein
MKPFALAEAFFAFGFVFSVVGLYWSRHKPADWIPPAWYRAGYLGSMDRDRFRLNCAVGLFGFPMLAAITFLWAR